MTELKTRAGAAGVFKFGVAALAAAALAFTGMAPANAAEVQLGPDSIIGFENGDESSPSTYNYDQWHIGNTSDPAQLVTNSLEFGECSITGLVPVEGRDVTQVLKGYPVDGRPSTVADIRAVIDSLSIDVLAGSVTLQLPFFAYQGDSDRQFTTLRNNVGFTEAGNFALTGETVITLSGATSDVGTLEEMLDEMELAEDEGVTFELLGVGFTLSEGASVSSIYFSGNQYRFGTGDCLTPAPVVPVAPKAPVKVDTGL